MIVKRNPNPPSASFLMKKAQLLSFLHNLLSHGESKWHKDECGVIYSPVGETTHSNDHTARLYGFTCVLTLKKTC